MSIATVAFTDALGTAGSPVAVPAGGSARGGPVSVAAGPGVLLVSLVRSVPLSQPPIVSVYGAGAGGSLTPIFNKAGGTGAGTELISLPPVGYTQFVVDVQNLDPTNALQAAAQFAAFTPA